MLIVGGVLQSATGDLAQRTEMARKYLIRCQIEIRQMVEADDRESAHRIARNRRDARKRRKHYNRINERGKCI